MPLNSSAESIIAANLADTDIKQTALFEIRLAHIRELAHHIVSTTTEPGASPSVREYWGGILTKDMLSGAWASARTARTDRALALNTASLLSLYGNLDVLSRALLCREILACLKSRYGDDYSPIDFLQTDEDIPQNARGRISYVENTYTDTAFSAASVFINGSSPSFAQSYAHSCDEVNSGHCEFCLLPIENASDGKLIGFYSLIDKYDLKITLALNISVTDGGAVTRFALCRRSISGEIHSFTRGNGQSFIEIRILPGDDCPVGDILTAAASLGLMLRRIDSMPLGYTDSEFAFNLVFRTDGAELASFLAFLSIWAPHYIPVGYYKVL